MQVDPKVSAILNIVVAVLGVLGTCAAQLTTLFGQGQAQTIITVASLTVTIIGAVNGGLHGISSPTAGPLVKSS